MYIQMFSYSYLGDTMYAKLTEHKHSCFSWHTLHIAKSTVHVMWHRFQTPIWACGAFNFQTTGINRKLVSSVLWRLSSKHCNLAMVINFHSNIWAAVHLSTIVGWLDLAHSLRPTSFQRCSMVWALFKPASFLQIQKIIKNVRRGVENRVLTKLSLQSRDHKIVVFPQQGVFTVVESFGLDEKNCVQGCILLRVSSCPC